MENALTTYFQLEDYVKDLLFNSVSIEQELRARSILEKNKQQGNYLYINKKALVSDCESNN